MPHSETPDRTPHLVFTDDTVELWTVGKDALGNWASRWVGSFTVDGLDGFAHRILTDLHNEGGNDEE